jgi:Ser/Thr protein kinase RdoA (MazF antagonist)
MDAEGRIKGFAKTSRTEAGKSLLVREADTLDYLKLLKLESVHVPSVVRRIDDPKSFTLVTDTLKTSRSKTATELSQAHLKFLGELSSRATSNGERDQVSAQTQIVQAALDRLTNWLPGEWKNRFDACVRIFQNEAELHTPALAHGDFTPWNTFSVNDKLYVFDWEYSGRSYPAGYDLIHFLWSSPALSRLNAETAVLALQKRLAAIPSEREKLGQETEILAYLCAHAAFYFQREFDAQRAPSEWGGESRAARAIDYLLSHC